MRQLATWCLAMALGWTGCTVQQMSFEGPEVPAFTNGLAVSSSPFLKRHAHDPVDWHPWSAETLQKAQDQDKPLLVVTGFMASHRCQAMQRSCFSDTTVAGWVNRYFIPVMVDREARPDLDAYFLALCRQLEGASAEWPLSAILLPDRSPIHAETYRGCRRWISRVHAYGIAYREQPERLDSLARALAAQRRGSRARQTEKASYDQFLQRYADQLMAQSDPYRGGLKGRPKRPLVPVIDYLMHHHARHGDARSRSLVQTTLDRMAFGGIYDHLGGGFFRLTQDEQWQRPRFEKMLYDQALLAQAYAQAYQLTRNPLYEQITYETLNLAEEQLKGPNSGYYASLAADSEREEGRYYLWPLIEVEAVLLGGSDMFCRYYNLRQAGPWPRGQNLPYRTFTDEELAAAYDLSLPEFREQMARMRDQMQEARQRRLLPPVDSKQVVAWNALMVSAWVKAYEAWGEDEFLDRALATADFLRLAGRDLEGNLYRYCYQDRGCGTGFLEDYAYTAAAFLDLYRATLDPRWLAEAKATVGRATAHFYQANQERFAFTQLDHQPAMPPPLDHPQAPSLPDPEALLVRLMQELYAFYGHSTYLYPIDRSLARHAPRLEQRPTTQATWGIALMQATQPRQNLLLANNQAERQRAELARYFLPGIRLVSPAAAQLRRDPSRLTLNPGRMWLCDERYQRCQPIDSMATLLRLIR